MIRPPRWHIIAWSTVKLQPHAHTDGLSGIGQSQRSLSAPRNSRLLRSRFMSFSGIAESQHGQLEAHFSHARSTALCVIVRRERPSAPLVSPSGHHLFLFEQYASAFAHLHHVGSHGIAPLFYQQVERSSD